MMDCELTVKDLGYVREYWCNDINVARLVLGANVLNVDMVKPWDYPVDKRLSIDNVSLIYWKGNVMGYDAEFVGYDDGSRRELISIRIFLNRELGDDEVKELILKIVRDFENG